MSTRTLTVSPRQGHTWAVAYEDDETALSEHPSREQALSEARSHAAQFGIAMITVLHEDGSHETQMLDAPDPGA
jgi:hypothetical protein